MHDLDPFLSERELVSKLIFDANVNSNSDLQLLNTVGGNDVKHNKFLQFNITEDNDFHAVKTVFSAQHKINGVGLRFMLNGWDEIKYLAIGFNHKGSFVHLKISHPLQNVWQSEVFSIHDLIYKIQNSFLELEPAMLTDNFSIKIKGKPSADGAKINVLQIAFFNEVADKDKWIEEVDERAISDKLMDHIVTYQSSSLKNSVEACEQHYNDGSCPIVKNIPWADKSSPPEGLLAVNTYRYSWHALHHVSKMILFGLHSENQQPVLDAGDFTKSWMEKSWYEIETDKKFMWYDHGVAERQLSLIMMYHQAINSKKELPFFKNLKKIILLQGRLLESGAFYASHQNQRYHNHAMFQDVALIVTALSFPNAICSKRWLRKGVDRLEDQIANLIVQDKKFSIFVENSIGYHSGVIRLIKLSSDIISLFDTKSIIHSTYQGMIEFSDLMTYPDGRTPAQGDTMRIPNEKQITRFRRKPVSETAILEKAGYFTHKGIHNDIGYMLCFFATSLNKTHKHEDNGSFTLFFDMVEWLIDPSHYSHEYLEENTAYLRSAKAHNIVSVEGVKASIETGLCGFKGTETEDSVLIESWSEAHENYSILRNILIPKDRFHLNFMDHVQTKSKIPNIATLTLNCGEFVSADINDKTVILSHPNSKHKLKIEFQNEEVEIHFGTQSDGILAISGLGFMEKSEINVIKCRIPIEQEYSWSITTLLENGVD
jgi:hypothetical protein